MKLFGGFIEFGTDSDSEFPISENLFGRFDNDIWKLVAKADELQNKGLKGLYAIRVKPKPDRVSVVHDKTISKQKVRKILTDEGLL